MTAQEATEATVVQIDLRRFAQILSVELEHLEAHARLLIAGYREREARREVTEHVCNENIAVLRNEEYGFCHFVRVLGALDITMFADLDELITAIRAAFEKELKAAGLARATYIFADRKIRKVQHYVETS